MILKYWHGDLNDMQPRAICYIDVHFEQLHMVSSGYFQLLQLNHELHARGGGGGGDHEGCE